MPGKETEHIV
ncbi:unnamed protein product [Staurois parvus]|uniref:Uncharacterized protein n=1 Tax=Staurois parvus TaxID=386267 RepID=A0ABN9EG72_9NEOB|nr:unnamed protein product [Staurois parvus]